MRNERAYVPGEWAAVQWAGGCLAAAVRERVLAARLSDITAVRWLVTLVIAFKVFDGLFATLLTVVYRLRLLGAAEQLGQLTPGDDFRRFVPLMELTPMWLHALWVTSACLYAATAVRFLARRHAALVVLVPAVAVETIANQLEGHLVSVARVAPAPQAGLAVVIVQWLVLTAGLTGLVWWAWARATALPRAEHDAGR
jgi:hypothetical protein